MSHGILVAWLGHTDIRASEGSRLDGSGPVGQAAETGRFAEIHLLVDFPAAKWQSYVHWLERRCAAAVTIHQQRLSSPVNFRQIYESAVSVLADLWRAKGAGVRFTYHLSPGTPAMAAVWILLAKTSYPAELLQSSKEGGVEVADIPFDIAAEFLPDVLQTAARRVGELAEARPPSAPAFEDIIHRSAVMRRVVADAQRIAIRPFPVLIEGESGTGKEMLARAIHGASYRAGKAFIAVNCGAIPLDLAESELFGHRKGAFSGAVSDRKGHFREADGGTLFLDEIGELPKAQQVKLLRVLQESEVTPVGESRPVRVDVRIIAATNRMLADEVAAGRFREDLLYRLAVAVIRLPPLRERKGDLTLLIDALIAHVNRQAAGEPGYVAKRCSASAKQLLLRHDWPGNVRELLNTLQRASVWADGDTIEAADVKRALISALPRSTGQDNVLERDIEPGVDLPELMTAVARHYLQRAVKHTHGNKTRAATLLGLRSYQTLNNWLSRYGVEG